MSPTVASLVGTDEYVEDISLTSDSVFIVPTPYTSDPAGIVEVIEVIEDGPRGYPGPPGATITIPFSKGGVLTAAYTSPFVLRMPYNCVMDSVSASVGAAPVGSSIVIDVLKTVSNNAPVSIYASTADRVAIPAGSLYVLGSTGTPSPANFSQGNGVHIVITQVGSTSPGSNLTMVLGLQRVV